MVFLVAVYFNLFDQVEVHLLKLLQRIPDNWMHWVYYFFKTILHYFKKFLFFYVLIKDVKFGVLVVIHVAKTFILGLVLDLNIIQVCCIILTLWSELDLVSLSW